MALYLNLYHEIQNQKLKRQRDPLKIAIMGLLLVAVGFIAYYFWRDAAVSKARKEQRSVEEEWKRLEPQQTAALAQKTEFEQNIKLADAMVRKIENRFYWAPLLERIMKIAPPDIQITGFDGALAADGSKKVTLSLNGVATGAQPRSVAEELRTALQARLSTDYKQVAASFHSLEDGVEPMQYEGRSSPTAIFSIELSFTSPDAEEAPKPPAPREKK